MQIKVVVGGRLIRNRARKGGGRNGCNDREKRRQREEDRGQ